MKALHKTQVRRAPKLLAFRTGLLALAAGSIGLAFAADVPTPTVQEYDSQTVRLTWGEAGAGYILQESDSPSRGGIWRGVAQAPTPAGLQREVILALPPDSERWFFRLRPRGALPGLDYLLANQSPSGLWDASTATRVRSSVMAIEALDCFGVGADAISLAASALAGGAIRNNDELARRTMVLAGLGQDVFAGVSGLLTAQNAAVGLSTSPSYPGQGWGLAAGFGSSTLDTALALGALRAGGLIGGLTVGWENVPAGTTSSTHPFTVVAGATDVLLRVRSVTGTRLLFIITPPGSGALTANIDPTTNPIDVGPLPSTPGTWTLAVQNSGGVAATYAAEVGFTGPEGVDYFRLTAPLTYLARSQNPDGGWGLDSERESQLMVTAEVLQNLASFGSTFVGPAVLNAGGAWLVGRQNGDGGFGSIPGISNVGETALAMSALRIASPAVPLGNAAAFLRSVQQPDGSWEGSLNLTAAAAKALCLPPQVSPIAGQSVAAPDSFLPINLDAFVADPDHADNQLTWTVSGNSQLSVNIVNRIATITYLSGTTPSETLTFTASDPDGLSGSASAVFEVSVLPTVDYVIARGGNVSDTRSIGGDEALLDQVASFTEQVINAPIGVTYSRLSFTRPTATEFEVGFQIDVDGGAPLGDHQFQVLYELHDEFPPVGPPLGPVTGSPFNFSIRIVP